MDVLKLGKENFKREVLYIKDDNQWVKDNKEKLTNAIKIVANKNIKQIFF